MAAVPSETVQSSNRLTTQITKEGDVVQLSLRDSSWGAGLFLLIWWLVWTCACVAIVWVAHSRQQPLILLFGLPFWISWLVAAGILLNASFGRQRIALGPEGLVHRYSVLVPISFRHVPLCEILHFRVRRTSADSDEGPKTLIELTTLGRSILFGAALPGDERKLLCKFLEDHLEQLRNQAGLADIPSGDLADCRPCQSPSDSTWRLDESRETLTFFQRGRLSLGALIGWVFLNGFWNGILMLFLGELFGFTPGAVRLHNPLKWIELFLFLIPFEIVGLVMLGLLLLQLCEPVRVTRWIFDGERIRCKTNRFGLPLGWRKDYSHPGIAQMTVKDERQLIRKKSGRAKLILHPTGANFQLALADFGNTEICVIEGLTLGEARWIKGRIQADPGFISNRGA